MNLLHIYDESDSGIVTTVRSRSVQGTRALVAIHAGGDNLISSLDGLVSSNVTCERILFETHGCSGRLYFGNSYIDKDWVLANMASRGYDSLCPSAARIYFNGCNVAEDPDGWAFMTAMGQIFLKKQGGEVFGHTSLGLEIPIYSWLTGHVVHLSGATRRLFFGPGAKVLGGKQTTDI